MVRFSTQCSGNLSKQIMLLHITFILFIQFVFVLRRNLRIISILYIMIELQDAAGGLIVVLPMRMRHFGKGTVSSSMDTRSPISAQVENRLSTPGLWCRKVRPNHLSHRPGRMAWKWSKV